MVTKWKSKLGLVAWLALFAFGLSGLSMALFHHNEYFTRDYFQTGQFNGQLNQFIDYLSMFKLNYIPKTEAKKEITVSPEDIREHRYRYGDLPQQIANLKAQYAQKIQDALNNKNTDLANFYTAERDKKIADITNNFKSDDYVRPKVVKEKEAKIDQYYAELEKFRPEFLRYQGAFQYYLQDTTTGAVYANLDLPKGKIDDYLNKHQMLFVRKYPSERYGYLSTENRNNYINMGIQDNILKPKASLFKGIIVVPKSAATINSTLVNFYDYQHRQRLFYVLTFSGLLSFALSLYLLKRLHLTEIIDMERWRRYYQLIPLDVRLVGFGITTLVTLSFLVSWDGALYLYDNFFNFILETIFHLLLLTFGITLTLVQGFYLRQTLGDWSKVKKEWPKTLIFKAHRGVKEAFLIRSMGTQIVIFLIVTLGFGAGALLVLVAPKFMILYVPAVLVIGLPSIILLIRQTGYFNRIVNNVGDVVRGNLEADLPVAGQSVLAKLADNINTLKRGVKTSQREQAKSERLKTELITNVSHDLRTPLTSIISYSELLKTPNLAEEDREAYIQIIDRKAKRLKILIDDLFEASKMASGNIELTTEQVDLVQLLQQALAEHNETIDQSTLTFRITTPDKPVYAIVDGQKLWRVFDNLIGNILKYSLEHTRVYISVTAGSRQAEITFKNVTKYELGENVDELFERFKRGDTSRHTEGSGLGLAIAKSIVDLHGGDLDISLDGDLFKVMIQLNTTVG